MVYGLSVASYWLKLCSSWICRTIGLSIHFLGRFSFALCIGSYPHDGRLGTQKEMGAKALNTISIFSFSL